MRGREGREGEGEGRERGKGGREEREGEGEGRERGKGGREGREGSGKGGREGEGRLCVQRLTVCVCHNSP